jgi:hypothetical protein
MCELYGVYRLTLISFLSPGPIAYIQKIENEPVSRSTRFLRVAKNSTQPSASSLPPENSSIARAAAGVYRDEKNVRFSYSAPTGISPKSTLAIENLNEAQRLGQIGNWSWDTRTKTWWSGPTKRTHSLESTRPIRKSTSKDRPLNFYTE